MVSEHQKLLVTQDAMEEASRETLVDLSVSETLHNLIVLGDKKRATALKEDFKVSDARYWLIQIKALAEMGDWSSLYTFARDKKSPVGMRPFAEACLEKANADEAAKYIAMFTDAEERLDWFIKIKHWQEAATLAAKARDGERLVAIRQACNDPRLQREIDAALSSL